MGFQNGWRGPNIVSDRLVLYLDAGSPNSYRSNFGTTWKDMSGNNYNGSLVNGPTYSTASGTSILFDGVDDYISVTSLSLGTNWTIESWFNLTSYPELANVFSTAYGEGWYASSLFGGSRSIGWYLDNNWRSTASNLYVTNTWNHLVAIVDGLNHYYYLNGNIVLSYTSVATPGSTSFGEIGRIYAVNQRYFPGYIANCMAYNRALLQNEVLQNYNAQKSRFGL